MRIVVCGTGWFPIIDAIRARLPEGTTISARAPGEPVRDAIRGADVVLPSNGRITAIELDASPSLRLVQQPAAGYDGIDLAAARARGVPVCNTPGANAGSVAEAALYLLLALARRAPAAAKTFRAAEIGAPLGVELEHKTLLVIGAGQTGGRVARLGEALGMHVLTARSTTTRAELLARLARADAVSLHCPLSPETRGLIDAEAFAHLKPGALLVNTARGPIIDRDAAEAALASGRLGGLGLDVFWQEPWDPADPLFAHDRVVTMPHVAGSTSESFGRIADVVVENVRRISTGEPLLHRIA
ncbi:hypothetical protein L6R52_30030 [Myxococcota bacterium]|nr:hypothetical protein [Myxococcota bacterium]